MVLSTVNQERSLNILEALLKLSLGDVVLAGQLDTSLLTDDEISHRTEIVYTERSLDAWFRATPQKRRACVKLFLCFLLLCSVKAVLLCSLQARHETL